MARALEARAVPAPPDAIAASVEGDVEATNKVLRITRIRVRYALTVPSGKRAAAERAVAAHPVGCPAWNTVRGCIDVDVQAEITEIAASSAPAG